MVWSLTVSSSNTPQLGRITKAGLLILFGAAAATVATTAYRRRRSNNASNQSPSAPYTVGGIRALIDQLIQQAYGEPDEVVPYLHSPSLNLKEFLKAPEGLALLCERNCNALRDFTGENAPPSALVIGCGVGASAFELSRAFPHVLGIDSSKERINAAKVLKERGWMRYVVSEEGELTTEHVAVLDDEIERDRVNFAVLDPSALPATFGTFEAVLLNEVLTELASPDKLLKRLPLLVRPGGVLVCASSYQWRESVTPKAKWLGGFRNKERQDVFTFDGLREELEDSFMLVERRDIPSLQRHHKRGFSVTVLEASVWKRK